MENKTYLGDSVYAELVDGGIRLTTENGVPEDPTNTIFLEPSMLDNLLRFQRQSRQVVDFGKPVPQLESIVTERQMLDSRQQAVMTLAKLCDGLEGIPQFTTAGGSLDFDELTHEQVVAVMKHLKAGKWSKELNPENVSVNYINTTLISGWNVRLWSAKPPETCKLVEEEVDVPEQIIPAHKEKKFKLVCKESVTAETLAETTETAESVGAI